MSFIERKISTKRTISILGRNGIEVNDSEAGVILGFLYLIAKNYRVNDQSEVTSNLKEKSNSSKSV